MSAPRLDSRFDLGSQVALITGAAGQLGQEFCRVLGRAGAHVVVADVELPRCEAVCRALGADSIKATPLAIDVASEGSVRSGFEAVSNQLGRLDILVNNAGIAVFTPFEDRPFSEFMRVLEVNVGGTFLCTQAAVRIMRTQAEGGRIVNIGSIYGVVSGDPRIYTDCDRRTSEAYAASKAAIIQITRYWAVHLAKYRIRVNALSPGGVFNEQGPDFVQNYSARTPLGRMARADELGEALLFLCSEASSYVTGHNLLVDGGWTAW